MRPTEEQLLTIKIGRIEGKWPFFVETGLNHGFKGFQDFTV